MNFKKEFPLLKKITFLDNAAGTLKPISVVASIKNFYLNMAVNPHSSDTPLAIKTLKIIEDTRQKIAKLVDATPEEVIFTSGTTDSLNRIALMLENLLIKKDKILISEYNHNSNVGPFIALAKRKKIEIQVSKNIIKDIDNQTKIIAISQINSGAGKNIDIKKLYIKSKEKKIILINDAAQSITLKKVSLKYSDVIVFSGNKIYGPTGIGVLIINKNLLKNLKPKSYGGGAISHIDNDLKILFKEGVHAFESGTPNTAGIIGLGAAIDFYYKTKKFLPNIKEISMYAHNKLNEIKNIKIYTKLGESIIIFELKNIPAQDVVSALARQNIYLRSGSFCNSLYIPNPNGLIRLSLGIYNNKKDIDKCVLALKKGDFFDFL